MAAMSLIESVIRQTLTTFSRRPQTVTSFEDNLAKLKSQVNKLTSADVKLDRNLLLNKSDEVSKNRSPSPSDDAPVTYIEIYEDPDVTIGIFVLKSGAKLPLHDHPLMYGILKVIHGKVRIQSYSILSNLTSDTKISENGEHSFKFDPDEVGLSSETLNRQVSLMARKEPEILVSEKDNVCVLTPLKGNIHELHSVDGPAAFVDILSPPYQTEIPDVGPRPCRYFKDLGSVGNKENIRRLLRISSPPDYWSESAPYQGPSFTA